MKCPAPNSNKRIALWRVRVSILAGILSLVILTATSLRAQDTHDTGTSETPRATVYVYRAPAAFKGRWSRPSVYCDGVEWTRLERGTFFKASLTPGPHLVSVARSEVGQFQTMEAGKTYFYRFGHKNLLATSLSGQAPLTLTAVPEATARQEMTGLVASKTSGAGL